ncbi:MAG TPA: hypothetical protein VFZ48_03070 [Candidatus Saccharimonadales bacterium]
MSNDIQYARMGSNGAECTFSWDTSDVKFSDEQQQELAEALAARQELTAVTVSSTSVRAVRTAKTWHSLGSFEFIMQTIARISRGRLMTTRDANRTYEG